MLDLFNIAKPQGCDIQTFYGSGPTDTQRTWTKPRGASHVYMMLIGGGGSGDGSNGGGSGAVTVWYGSAKNIPDSLVVVAGSSGNSSTVSARFSNSGATPTALLTGNGQNLTTGAPAMTANQFTASGFFQSVAGQGGSSGTINPSSVTFLSGGADSSGIVQANYGYGGTVGNGYFQMQPIIVGVGGTNQIAPYSGGIGCGAGSNAGKGGPGMVLIASW